MEYIITLRSGKSISHTGTIDTITCFGYVRLVDSDGREVAMHRVSDVGEIRKVSK